ncbi:MAG: GNAT family N-acetyltransferase [Verrucomicrobiales bacterium]
MSSYDIRSLPEKDHLSATGLLAHLNPDCPTDVLIGRFRRILREHPHYYPVGAYQDGTLVGFGAAWIATKIWCGRYLEVDNIVVHPDLRSSGIGGELMRYFEKLAKDNDCNLITLDSYTSNYDSHRFYHRHGYEIWGFHFVKTLTSLDR